MGFWLLAKHQNFTVELWLNFDYRHPYGVQNIFWLDPSESNLAIDRISSSFVKCRDINSDRFSQTFPCYTCTTFFIGFLYQFLWSLTKVHGLFRQGSILIGDTIRPIHPTAPDINFMSTSVTNADLFANTFSCNRPKSEVASCKGGTITVQLISQMLLAWWDITVTIYVEGARRFGR